MIFLPTLELCGTLLLAQLSQKFSTEYIMGSLPAARVTISGPFNNRGVDYAGPYFVKNRTRNQTVTEAYLSHRYATKFPLFVNRWLQ